MPLPANKLKVDVLLNSGKIVDITRNEVGADSSGGQGNQDVKMNFPDLLDVVSFGVSYPVDDSSGLNPFSFVRRDDPQIAG